MHRILLPAFSLGPGLRLFFSSHLLTLALRIDNFPFPPAQTFFHSELHPFIFVYTEFWLF